MNFYEIIFLFFSFVAFLLAFLFFLKRKGDKVANKLLGIYVALFGYNIFINVLFWSKKLYTQDFIHLVYTHLIIWVLYGPILYFYLRRVIRKSKFKIIDLVHFIPLIYILINYSQVYLLSAENNIGVYNNNNWSDYFYHSNPYLFQIIIALMFVYYGFLVSSFRNALKSFNESRWLNWITYSFLGYILSFSAYFILKYFDFIAIGYDYLIGYSMIFFVGLLSYFSFTQPDVFNGLSMDKVVSIKKYQKTGLSKEHPMK